MQQVPAAASRVRGGPAALAQRTGLVPLLEVAVLSQDVQVGEVIGDEFLFAGRLGASRLWLPLLVGIGTSTISPAWTVWSASRVSMVHSLAKGHRGFIKTAMPTTMPIVLPVRFCRYRMLWSVVTRTS